MQYNIEVTSASEVTTLWHYTNMFIIIIIIFFSPPAQRLIIIIVFCDHFVLHSVSVKNDADVGCYDFDVHQPM